MMKKLLCVFAILTCVLRLQAQQYQSQLAPLYAANAKYLNGTSAGYAPTAGAGLTLNISSGRVNCFNTMVNYAGGTLSMTNSTTNYVYLNTAVSCAPASNTTGYSSSTIPVATVVTSGGAITSITDDRTLGMVAIGSGLTSINSAAGPAITVVGAGVTNVVTDTVNNKITISGGTAGDIAGTWVPSNSAAYTFVDGDNKLRYRFSNNGATFTLPQAGQITSSPFVSTTPLVNASIGGTASSPYTSGAFSVTAHNQMIVTFVQGGSPLATITSITGGGCTFSRVAHSADTNVANDVWYCSDIPTGGSTTLVMNFTGTVGAIAGICMWQMQGTALDNGSSSSLNGTTTLALNNLVHEQYAVAIAGGRTNLVSPTPPFKEIDTFFNGNIQSTSYRILSFQNTSSITMAGNNTAIFQVILSISGIPSFVAGWQVLAENVSGGNQTYQTTTPDTFSDGTNTFTLASGNWCSFMSSGNGGATTNVWNAICNNGIH